MILKSIHRLRLELSTEHAAQTDANLKQVLVPLDFSACSENALHIALAMALRTGADLKLLHTISMPLSMATEDMLQVNPLDELEKATNTKLAEIAREIETWVESEKYPPMTISTEVRKGFTAEEILLSAQDGNTDFVVMGTTGAGRVKGLLLGSTASQVLRKCKLPVLIVPEEVTFFDLGKVVFATDMVHNDPDALKAIVHFASIFGAELEVVHVLPPDSELSVTKLSNFDQAFSKVNAGAKTKVKVFDPQHGNIVAALQQYLAVQNADAVAMLTHDRGFFEKLFHPSLTEKMAQQTALPLLALHDK